MDPTLLWQHAGHQEAIYGLACSPDGRVLASCGADGTLHLLWPAPLSCFFTHPQLALFHDLAVSPSTNLLLAAACSDGMVWLWDGRQQRVLGHMLHQGGEVLCVAFSPAGDTIASGASDGSVCLWDLQTQQRRLQLSRPLPLRGVAFHPTRSWLATASEDGTLCLWDWTSGQLLATLVSGTSWVTCVAFSPDGAWLMGGLEQGEILLVELATGQITRLEGGHSADLLRVAFSADSRLCVTSSAEATLCCWSLKRQKLLRTPLGQPAEVAALLVLPTPSSEAYHLVTGDATGQVRGWSLSKEHLP